MNEILKTLDDIEEAWEEVKDMPEMKLSPIAINWFIETIKQLQEEIERYKEALEDIVKCTGSDYTMGPHTIAKQALEGVPHA